MFKLLSRVGKGWWTKGHSSGSKGAEKQIAPEHAKYTTSGCKINNCLRELERLAGLPKRSLYIKGAPKEVKEEPFGVVSRNHTVSSRLVELKNKGNQGDQGSIIGYIIENFGAGCPCKFLAVLHVNRGCPGLYVEGVCTRCGNTAH